MYLRVSYKCVGFEVSECLFCVFYRMSVGMSDQSVYFVCFIRCVFE